MNACQEIIMNVLKIEHFFFAIQFIKFETSGWKQFFFLNLNLFFIFKTLNKAPSKKLSESKLIRIGTGKK